MNGRTRRPKIPPVKTMSDIAGLAGVSESTVSRALADSPVVNAKTRERIQNLARAAGFSANRAASSLRSRQSKVIAVVIPIVLHRDRHMSDLAMMSMLIHVADALADRGYDLLLCEAAAHEFEWAQLIRSRLAAGAILFGNIPERPAIHRATGAGLPIVVWGRPTDDQGYITVSSDDRQGGYLATRHLIETGRRRIVFLAEKTLAEISQRWDGYLRAHLEANLIVDPILEIRSGFTAADAHSATARILASGAAFDGIVAGSDIIAMSAMQALNEAGRSVPGDVGVIGYGDVEIAALTTPALTTVRQDLKRAAALLVEKVIAASAGRPAESVELPASLVVRKSTQRFA